MLAQYYQSCVNNIELDQFDVFFILVSLIPSNSYGTFFIIHSPPSKEISLNIVLKLDNNFSTSRGHC